ncbi:hypothetical protein N9E09_00960 [bacterium]|jgi:hypothetical protein|nr:hypothetical protein [bacterium]
MIHSMLEIEIRDAVEKSENLNEDYSINWNFVDADAYAACRSFWKDDEQFYESFNEIVDMIISERKEEADAERQLSFDIGE